MHKIKYIAPYIIICLLVSSCTSTTTFAPDNLPDAKLGKRYYVQVNIGGGPGPVIGDSFYYTISPSDSGITLTPDKSRSFPYNHLEISGTPQKINVITISIAGETYGTSRQGHDFNKIFTIKVEK